MIISIHALLAESDKYVYVWYTVVVNFYPRSPCGERRVTVLGIQHKAGISIHALLAESDGGFGVGSWPRGIFLSTLSLRRATVLGLLGWLRVLISIHALLAESDGSLDGKYFLDEVFLSTLSLRRATRKSCDRY